jgi:hypothetical protein
VSEIVTTTSAITLDTLAAGIRQEVEAAEADFQSAVAHAVRAGELLIEAKATVGHGGWIPWLERNFAFTRQTASGYMRLAKHPDHMEGAPSISVALKQIAPPKAEPTSAPVTEPSGSRAKTTMCRRCERRVRIDRPHKCPETRRQLEEARKALLRAYAHVRDHPGAVADLAECLELTEECASLVGKVRAQVCGEPEPSGRQHRLDSTERTIEGVGYSLCECGSRLAARGLQGPAVLLRLQPYADGGGAA